MTNGNAAHQLLGHLLPEGWKVIDRLEPSQSATGGIFSVGYVVESVDDGKKAFLKALDYSKAFAAPDPARVLQSMTSAFNFERDILEKCKKSHLSRIVMAITDGKYDVPGITTGISTVNYLIFELADGDVRKYLDIAGTFDIAWVLRCLHHIATGLSQLHGQGMAHQDLKPSNVLVFGGKSSKIGDVGRVVSKEILAPHEDFEIAGDEGYAPLELLYRYIDPDWDCRRLGCDAYLLGSIVVFFFLNVGMTSAILNELHPSHYPGNWSGTFFDVLPYLRIAFNRVIEKFEQCLIPELKDELSNVVRQLCEPDPNLRGHPLTRRGVSNPYSLKRYVTKFDLLARKAEYGYFGKPR
jgi:serine/threonine protein kinase